MIQKPSQPTILMVHKAMNLWNVKVTKYSTQGNIEREKVSWFQKYPNRHQVFFFALFQLFNDLSLFQDLNADAPEKAKIHLNSGTTRNLFSFALHVEIKTLVQVVSMTHYWNNFQLRVKFSKAKKAILCMYQAKFHLVRASHSTSAEQ